jgi:putative nucleotidyltransferase with HDIG domain
MDTDFRTTGIEMIGDMPWGTHFCLFYETKQDLLDILIPYFKAGLENNEFCLWVTPEPFTVEEAQVAMRGAMPDFDRYLSKGQFELISHTNWYLMEGGFESKRVIQKWMDKLDGVLKQGFSGMRCIGNTFWLERHYWKNFAEYEIEVDAALSHSKLIVMCTYALERCSASEVLDVVQQHQFTVTRRNGVWRQLEGSELRFANEEIRKFNATLERRVEERASQLAAANEQLRIEINERKQAERRIQRQLEHFTALREIEHTIVSSFDLQSNLKAILIHVTRELGVDAADVLLLNPGFQVLEYGAGTGFRTKKVEKTRVRLGESHAGRVALERQLIQIPNLKDRPDDFLLTNVMAGEDFASYFSIPLIVKGVVNGVLEVFHRAPLEPDREWLDFLSALAGQTAIAIDNANLFKNLQRSNINLTLAYDATIEGWSQAMDLRDKETEGHTLRVTEMTMKLADLFGIKDEELIDIRRGALLHDIGKMGVPDGILLKPGPLTDDEWVMMKKHPTFAYELLAPIRFLQKSLDIPYCHHEKWDGTGYPRGLKGEQIPLSARIFALVDVWDALTSDRPYRKAWAKEKAFNYIKSGGENTSILKS